MLKPRKLPRTPDDAFAAGWEDGASDAPLTAREIEKLVILHAAHLTTPVEEVAS